MSEPHPETIPDEAETSTARGSHPLAPSPGRTTSGGEGTLEVSRPERQTGQRIAGCWRCCLPAAGAARSDARLRRA